MIFNHPDVVRVVFSEFAYNHCHLFLCSLFTWQKLIVENFSWGLIVSHLVVTCQKTFCKRSQFYRFNPKAWGTGSDGNILLYSTSLWIPNELFQYEMKKVICIALNFNDSYSWKLFLIPPLFCPKNPTSLQNTPLKS